MIISNDTTMTISNDTTMNTSIKALYADYIYPGYEFERGIYLFTWEILVTVTSLSNFVIINVLMHKHMRSATNMILVAIAISDSLTGLVTLPSYIAVYQKFEPKSEYLDMNYYASGYEYNDTEEDYYLQDSQEGYLLDKDLCRYFMISKFFVSKTFHTMSIWLTLFLGIQRFIFVAYPFKAQVWFSIKNTLIVCAVGVLCSPVIHVFHLIDEKAHIGWCEWRINSGGLAYLWTTFFLLHGIPCFVLVVFTVLFIVNLHRSASNVQRMSIGRNKSLKKRNEENRRLSIVVIAIVIVFLIPEIPYGIFILYTAILETTHSGSIPDLKTNRAIHTTYELSLVVSFHANFYIYTFLNRKFRSTLRRIVRAPIYRVMGRRNRKSVSRTSSAGNDDGRRIPNSSSNAEATEMNPMNSSFRYKSKSTVYEVFQPNHEKNVYNDVRHTVSDTNV